MTQHIFNMESVVRTSGRARKPNTRFDDYVLPQKKARAIKSTTAAAKEQQQSLTLSSEQPSLPEKEVTATPDIEEPLPGNEEPPSNESDNTAPEADLDTAPEADPTTLEGKIQLVKKLYKDINFSGAYSGIQTFQRCLLSQKGIHISQTIIAQALNQFPNYVMVRAALLASS